MPLTFTGKIKKQGFARKPALLRGTESRQKTEELLLFCLPDTSKSTRAASKVDKKRGECLFFVYRLVQIQGGENLKVEQNLEKLKKYSTRLPSPKHFGLRLRANSKKQRFARDRGQVQRLSCCRTALPLAKSLPFTDKSMKIGSLSVNGPPENYRLRTKWSKTALCP